MMSLEQYLLTKLVEECTEVAQMALKAQQFGLDNHHPKNPGITNRERLQREFMDVVASVKMLNEIGFGCGVDEALVEKKADKVKHFMSMSIDLGKVEESALRTYEAASY